MLQSSPFYLNITNKIPKFTGFTKLACRFGHSKENVDLHVSLHHQKYCRYQSYQGTTSSRSAKFSNFRLSEGTIRNKSLELVLEQNAKALSSLLLDFLIFMRSFTYQESSELVDRRYDSRNTLKKFRYKCFKCLFLAMAF